MSVVGDSSPPPKTLGKRLSGSSAISNCYSFPSNFKKPKLDAVRSFPINCFVTPPSLHCSDVKRSNLDLAGDFSGEIEINGGKSEWSGSLKKPRLLDGPVIAAVPLRSLPLASHGKDDDVVGLEMPNKIKTTAHKQEYSWERESEKLARILAEAKEFIDILDGKNSTSKDFQVVPDEKDYGMGTSGEDSDEGVCVLSPIEGNMLPLYSKGDGAKDSMSNVEEELEKWRTQSSSEKLRNMVLESQGAENVDGPNSYWELIETKHGEEQNKHNMMDSNPKYCESHQELINLEMTLNEQPQRSKVMETLRLFEEQYVTLSKERKLELTEGKLSQWTYAHVEAALRVKKMGKCISLDRPFGHIPGIEIGDTFRFRAELALVGLHRQPVSGIDHVVIEGKKCATSVVDSGRYENTTMADGVLIYSGQGGNSKVTENAADQTLQRGNLALVNSMEMGFPVRVIFKRRTSGTDNVREYLYVYDGLYMINDYWEEREGEQGGKLVYKFELHRLSCQPGPRETNARWLKPIKRKGVCVLNDVSQGKEKFYVRAMNGEDDDLPQPFTYITEIIYPDWFKPIEPIGCGCTDGCSDSKKCSCVLKNGGEIPFNENGDILEAKPRVYECGPSCNCPPTCLNRVTQKGPSHQLEIFKTESRGWGVRSRDFISIGSFICEYIGELLRDTEAEERTGNDEYLFDICDSNDEVGQEKSKEEGFALDAAVYGNIGRFINHSCSPNLYAQEVLYDHDDKRFPHIMFFAKKNIPSRSELTYHYNYKVDRICDENGNIKKKACHCGSPKCTGRMY